MTPRIDFDALFENDLDACALADASRIVLRVNRAFTELFGYTSDEAVGSVLEELIVPEQLRAEAIDLREHVRTARAARRDTVRQRKDGRQIPVSIVAQEVEVADGASILYVQYRDITEQKSTAQRREAALALFTALIESMRDGVLVETADHRIATLNPAVMAMFGVKGTPADLIGMRCEEAARAAAALTDNEDAFLAAKNDRIAAGISTREQLEFTDGRVLERDYAPIRDASGVVSGHLWVYRDLTAVLSLQEQSRQRLKMEAIGRLAGGVAHDFNNLITVLQGHAALLLDEPLPTHVAQDVHEIIKAANKAASLTRQLLAFSRQQVLRPSTLDLNAVVRDLQKSLMRLVREDIVVEISLDPDTPPVVADRTQIDQVLLNLAVNARDAMPLGGRLDVKTSVLSLQEPLPTREANIPPDTYAVLEVGDSGEGIDLSTLPRIFDPFFTTREQGKGTGLGLATVYGIVKQSGGYITVDSKRGQGALFRVFLPRARTQ